MRMARPLNVYDRVAISARERIKNLKRWIAQEDSIRLAARELE